MKASLIFIKLLREVGLKSTPARLDLLNVISKQERPFTVTEIASQLPHINQITIYRALEAMVVKGLVGKVDMQHPYTHYELLATKKHHHHAICCVCGKLEDVDLCLPISFEKNVLKGLKNFSSIHGHSLEFIGTCMMCTNKKT